MYTISNRDRREAIDFLTAFVELTAGGGLRLCDQKRRARLLIRKLQAKQEISRELLKRLGKEQTG